MHKAIQVWNGSLVLREPDSLTFCARQSTARIARKGVIDSGCSRNMTGNKSYLSDYGRNWLEDFPRKDNMYSVDLKNIVPSGGLTCLFAKATLDESNLWHRRLGYINFKTMNKLVKGNLVRGLPSKLFENDHTCIACQKGKQHKASYSKLPTTFWAEAVNTACYVQNRVLVIKPHNKTLYELFLGRKPTLNFIRPFGCPVTILNTLDHLVKFDGKSNDGFFVGYSINSKAFRLFNTRIRFVEENLHIKFLENKPNVTGTRPNWMFNIDTLTMSMNYQPVFAGNQTNCNAGIKANIDAGQARKKTISGPQYVLLPFLTSDSQGPKSSNEEVADDAGKQNEAHDLAKEGKATNTDSTNKVNTVSSSVNVVSSSFTTVDPGRERAQRNEFESVFGQDKNTNGNSTYRIFTPVNATGSSYENLGGSIPVNAATFLNDDFPTDPLMPGLEDTVDLQVTGIFSSAYDDDDVGAEADLNNLETTMSVSPIPTTRIHKDHPKEQIIGDINLATQTKRMIKMSEEHAMVRYINKQRRTNHKDYQNCLFAYFLSQIEPKKVIQALINPSWIEAMQKELLQFKLQKVWTLVDLPKGKRAIRTKFQVTPKDSHLYSVKRIFRYLKGHPKLGLWYPRDSPFDLEAFSDSDYAGASLDRKSTKEQSMLLLLIAMDRIQCLLKDISKLRLDITSSEIHEKRLIQVIKNHTYHNVLILLIKALMLANFRYFDLDKERQYLIELEQQAKDEFQVSVVRATYYWQVYLMLLVAFNNVVKIKNVEPIKQKRVKDETVIKEWEDIMERAATTASSLEAEQDSGNINRTQSMATLNESFP
ncbi:ribonuclease H-like domain-containing protein [Tanacetum coccineum]